MVSNHWFCIHPCWMSNPPHHLCKLGHVAFCRYWWNLQSCHFVWCVVDLLAAARSGDVDACKKALAAGLHADQRDELKLTYDSVMIWPRKADKTKSAYRMLEIFRLLLCLLICFVILDLITLSHAGWRPGLPWSPNRRWQLSCMPQRMDTSKCASCCLAMEPTSTWMARY